MQPSEYLGNAVKRPAVDTVKNQYYVFAQRLDLGGV
jgi:hypothetical protein